MASTEAAPLHRCRLLALMGAVSVLGGWNLLIGASIASKSTETRASNSAQTTVEGKHTASSSATKFGAESNMATSFNTTPEVVSPPAVLGPNSTCNDVVSWLSEDASSPVLLQLVNREYLRMQGNFLLAMEKHSAFPPENIFLLCTDEDSLSFMSKKFGIRCVKVNGVVATKKDTVLGTHRNYQIWNFRTKVLACLLEEGLDVLMSDNDALWLRDPLLDLRDIPGNLLTSRGHWPPEYADPEYGTTMCMGFALFRAGGESMSTLLRILQRHVADFGDDQIGINLAAQQLRIEWKYNDHSDMRYINSTGLGSASLVGLPSRFEVTYLPHNKYTRDCDSTPISSETVVAHCFPRNHREEAIKNATLWFLDDSR